MTLQDLIDKWKQLPTNCLEADLNSQFFIHVLNFLGLTFQTAPTIAGGISPDFVVYDQNSQPLLVVETKKRIPILANQPTEESFIAACNQHSLYREAVGYDDASGNGIRQYLSVRTGAARYGLIFNGDFFQLFRKVDGIIIPLTEIKRVTAESLSALLGQLKFYLSSPQRAFTISLWNRKGGVAKTTNTINIAAVLAERKKRVLVVDFDPQVDLTKNLGLTPDTFENMFLDCLDKIQEPDRDGTRKLLEDLIQRREFSLPGNQGKCSIYILPGNRKTLEKFGETLSDQGYQMRNKPTALKRLLEIVAFDYDYILIDTSPKTDMLTICGLFAADGIIIPSDYDPETLRHASDISQHLIPHKIRAGRKAAKSKKSPVDDVGPHILGLVFSNCADIGVTLEGRINDYMERQIHIKVCKTKLRRYDMVAVAKFARIPVVFHRPKSTISKLYNELVDEIFFSNNFIEIEKGGNSDGRI